MYPRHTLGLIKMFSFNYITIVFFLLVYEQLVFVVYRWRVLPLVTTRGLSASTRTSWLRLDKTRKDDERRRDLRYEDRRFVLYQGVPNTESVSWSHLSRIGLGSGPLPTTPGRLRFNNLGTQGRTQGSQRPNK